MKRCVSIYSLAFSGDGQYLAASSNTETVHVFRLEMSGRGGNAQDGRRQSAAAAQQAAAADGTDGSWMGYLGRFYASARLERRVCPFIRCSVRPTLRPSVSKIFVRHDEKSTEIVCRFDSQSVN